MFDGEIEYNATAKRKEKKKKKAFQASEHESVKKRWMKLRKEGSK